VAIVPFVPKTANNAIDADVVLTWDDIRKLAEELMGRDHYVTVRLRNAVERYNHDHPQVDRPTLNYEPPKLTFEQMREKCRECGNTILVGQVGGEDALLKFSLVDAEKKQWKWRKETTGGSVVPGHWLSGARWLAIVESKHGFGGGGA